VSSVPVQNPLAPTAPNRFGSRQTRIPDDGEVVGGLHPITWPEIESK
jgi:hypothetical protein